MKTFKIYLAISYTLIITDFWFRLKEWLGTNELSFGIVFTLFVLYWTSAITCGYLLVREIIKSSVAEKSELKRKSFNEGVIKTFDTIYTNNPAIMRKDVDLFNDEHQKIGSSTVWGQISDCKAKILK